MYESFFGSAHLSAMPKTLPVLFIDEALLPESRQFSSSVKGWRLKTVDRKLPRTLTGLEHRHHGGGTSFSNTRGALHRTMSAAARLGIKWTYVEEDAQVPEPLKALPPIEPSETEKLSVPDELPKVNRSRKKHATMPARVGPKEELTSARMEEIGKAARGRLLSDALPDVAKTSVANPPLTAAGEPDVPVVIRKKKKVVTMPELRPSPPTL
eukprot:s1151_g13.t1